MYACSSLKACTCKRNASFSSCNSAKPKALSLGWEGHLDSDGACEEVAQAKLSVGKPSGKIVVGSGGVGPWLHAIESVAPTLEAMEATGDAATEPQGDAARRFGLLWREEAAATCELLPPPLERTALPPGRLRAQLPPAQALPLAPAALPLFEATGRVR